MYFKWKCVTALIFCIRSVPRGSSRHSLSQLAEEGCFANTEEVVTCLVGIKALLACVFEAVQEVLTKAKNALNTVKARKTPKSRHRSEYLIPRVARYSSPGKTGWVFCTNRRGADLTIRVRTIATCISHHLVKDIVLLCALLTIRCRAWIDKVANAGTRPFPGISPTCLTRRWTEYGEIDLFTLDLETVECSTEKATDVVYTWESARNHERWLAILTSLYNEETGATNLNDQFQIDRRETRVELTTGFAQYTKSRHGFGICGWGTKIPFTIARTASKNGRRLAATVGDGDADASANENKISLHIANISPFRSLWSE